VHHFADQIIAAITENSGWGSNIVISDETDVVLETGGGLMKAGDLLEGGSFVLMNVDILTDMNLTTMIAMHKKLQPLATIATTNRSTSRYFLFDHLGNLCGWTDTRSGEEKIVRETADRQKRAFSGIHVIDPRIFSLAKLSGKFSMVDLYLSLAGQEIIKGFDHSETRFIDVGKPEAVAQAESMF
jgi:NDP-sugar pyrophosphorylase family protein